MSKGQPPCMPNPHGEVEHMKCPHGAEVHWDGRGRLWCCFGCGASVSYDGQRSGAQLPCRATQDDLRHLQREPTGRRFW